MRFIYQYPDAHGTTVDLLDSGRVHVLAAAAEAAGWDGFAFTEHPVPSARWLESGGHQTLDPFVALGHVAAATSRRSSGTVDTTVKLWRGWHERRGSDPGERG